MRRSGNEQPERPEECDHKSVKLKHAAFCRWPESPDAHRGETRRNARWDKERHANKERCEKIASEAIKRGKSLRRGELFEEPCGVYAKQFKESNKLLTELRRRTCTEGGPAFVACNERYVDKPPDQDDPSEEEEQRKERVSGRCHN